MNLSAWQQPWLEAFQGGAIPPQLQRGAGLEPCFAVYRAGYFENLIRALADTYPVVERLVGADFFRAAARRYVTAHPSRHGDLHQYGGGFATFLADFPPVRSLPYLPDVARLEWLAHCAFHAADAAPLDLARLACVPPEHTPELCFQLHPSVQLMVSDYPVHRIWHLNQADQDEIPTMDLSEGAVWLAVLRDGLEITLLPLPQGAYCLAAAFAARVNFAAACEQALSADPALDAGLALHTLIQHRVVTGFTA
jgi:hypothetical protein